MAEQATCESDTLRALDHRVRNNYAALLSLVDLTRSSTTSVAEFALAMTGHIRAIATSHDLLSRSDFRSVSLGELAKLLGRAPMQESLSVEGPEVHVASRQSVALSLVLQQLFALVPRNSAMHVVWRWIDESDRRLELRIGAADFTIADHLAAPARSLLEGLVKSELRGKVEFSEEATLSTVLDSV